MIALFLAFACQAPQTDTTEIEAKIDRWMARYKVDRTALVANRCGEPWIEVRRNAPKGQTYALASSSKWISAVGFLAARDAGLIDLDAPMGTWLNLGEDRKDATIRQVLGHRSGFTGIHRCMGSQAVSLQECALIIDAQAGARPDAQFRYANTGFTVAAAAVEKAAGRPFTDLFDDVLLDPMALSGTSFGSEQANNPNPSYGLTSTAEDYLAVLQMLLDGGGDVLTKDSVDEMWQGKRMPRTGFVPPGLRAVPHPIYGLGVWLSAHEPDGTPTVASAQGRYGFQPWIDRKRQIAAVYAVELGGPGNPDHRSSPPEVKGELAKLADAAPPCD